jgi:hypothetical protein
MIMRHTLCALLATSVLAAAGGSAIAACTVEKWTDGTHQRPIWKCTDEGE